MSQFNDDCPASERDSLAPLAQKNCSIGRISSHHRFSCHFRIFSHGGRIAHPADFAIEFMSGNATIYMAPMGTNSSLYPAELPHYTDIPQYFGLSNANNKLYTLPYDSVLTTNLKTYRETRDSGISQAKKIIQQIDSQCPHTRFHFYGYSEGADVAAHLVNSIAQGNGPISKDQLGSSVMQGNPVRQTNGVTNIGTAPVDDKPLFQPLDYGDQSNKVMEICDARDFACDTSASAPELLHHVLGDQAADVALLRGQIDIPAIISHLDPPTIFNIMAQEPSRGEGGSVHSYNYYLPRNLLPAIGFIKQHEA